MQREPLHIYLSITESFVSSVLVQERRKEQRPIYLIRKTLHGPELRYQRLEKLTLALLTLARKLRPYFQSHHIVVRTDQPITQVPAKPESPKE